MASFNLNEFVDKIRQRFKPALPKHYVAIDFDSTAVRIVHARRNGKTAGIDTLYTNPMPEDLDLDDAEAVGQFLGVALKEFSRTARVSLNRCGVLMSVPRQKAVLKPLTLPPGTPREEIASMVRFQVEKDLPFNPAEAVIDFTITNHLDPSESGNGSEQSPGMGVLVSAVAIEVVQHYRQIAEAAGIKLRRLGLRPYANMKCVDACVRRGEDETVMSVHISGNETEINVLKGASLAFCRSAVIDVPANPGDGDNDAVQAVVREVVRSVHSYSSAQHHGEVSAILVSGGTGIESSVLELLENKLKVQCEALAPASAMNLPTAGGASAYSPAIGLAIAHQGQALPFDFLNPKQPPAKRDTKKTRAAMIAAAAVLAIAIIAAAINMYLGSLEEPLEAANLQLAKLRRQTKGYSSLDKRAKAADKWVKARTDWVSHLALVSQLAPGCEVFYVKSKFETHLNGTIVFKAYAKGRQVLEDFKARLTAEGYNPQSKKGSGGVSTKDHFTHSEEITLTVKPGMKVDLKKHKYAPRPSDDVSGQTPRTTGSSSGSSRYGGYRRPDRSSRSRSGGSRR